MNLRILKRPARPRFAPAAVDLLPQDDLPRIESRAIAEHLFDPRPGPGVVQGKGLFVERNPETLDEHAAHPVVAEFRRPRKFICWCGQPATLMYPAVVQGAPPIRRCAGHPDPHTLGVVDGGGAA